MTVSDTKLIDALIAENRAQREIIRELMRENAKAEKYWIEFALKLLQKGSAA